MTLGDGVKAAALLFVAAVAQVSVFSQIHVFGAVPDVLLVTLVALALLRAFHPELGLGATLAISAAGAGFGALAELFSLRIDDNLSVPVAAAAGAALVMFAV